MNNSNDIGAKKNGQGDGNLTHKKMPAEEGIWVFIIGDMLIFAAFFHTFLYYGRVEPEVFKAGQGSLSVWIGLLNTFVLLISSWFVILGLRAVRAMDNVRARKWLSMAIVMGLVFTAVKVFEYGTKINAGITPATDNFYMLYFIFTGLHLFHVLLGILFLGLMIKMLKCSVDSKNKTLIEGGAIFWHMVDLLWIILFPLIYVVRL